MSLTFNQFQQELKRRVDDPQLAYMLTMMYEHFIALAKQTDENAEVLLALATSMEGIVELHRHTQEGLKQVARGRMPDGIDVHSVANEPEN